MAGTRLALAVQAVVLGAVVSTAPADDPAGSASRPAADVQEEVSASRGAVALSEDAEGMRALDNPRFRQMASQIFQTAAKHAKADRFEEAEKWYELGLGRFPWELQQQLGYASFLLRCGKSQKGKERARIVAEHAEDPALRRRAMALLGKQPVKPAGFATVGKIEDPAPFVLLIPIGSPQPGLLADVQARLEQLMGLQVLVRTAKVEMVKPSRDRVAELAKALRTWILANGDRTDVKYALREWRIRGEDIEKDEEVIRLYRFVLETSPETADAEKFDRHLSLVRMLGKQWEASELIDALKKAVQADRRDDVAYVGVTDRDIHAGARTNFVYADVARQYAVVSYRRFRAAFTGEPQDRKRLVGRLLKQCLSAAANALGVKRCSCPTCPYAAAISLLEHDARTTRFCSECSAALAKLRRRRSRQ